MWILTGQQAHWPIVNHQTNGTVFKFHHFSITLSVIILSHYKIIPPSTGFSTNSSQYDMAGLVTLGESLELTQVRDSPKVGKGQGSIV